MKKGREEIWNPANACTLTRIALIPVFLILYQKGDRYGALVVYLAAGLTDLLDGWIARRYNMVTRLGQWLDPLADKLLNVTVLCALAASGSVDWMPALLAVAKEFVMISCGAILLKRRLVIPSRALGKVAQALFIVALSLSFFHDAFRGWTVPLDVIVLWSALLLSLGALIHYLIVAFRDSGAARDAA